MNAVRGIAEAVEAAWHAADDPEVGALIPYNDVRHLIAAAAPDIAAAALRDAADEYAETFVADGVTSHAAKWLHERADHIEAAS